MDWLLRIRLQLLTELETYNTLDDGTDAQDDDNDGGVAVPMEETQDGKSMASKTGVLGATSSLRGLLLPEPIRNLQWGWWFVIALLAGALTARAWTSRHNLRQAQ